MEKKLTDEEIVKALEMDCLCVVYGGCESCPLFDKDCKIMPKAIKDLIHRLQDKIAEYERKIEDGELVSKEWHDEQVLHDKAEIERLTEELATYIRKAGFYYKKCKEYGIECFHDNDLEVD